MLQSFWAEIPSQTKNLCDDSLKAQNFQPGFFWFTQNTRLFPTFDVVPFSKKKLLRSRNREQKTTNKRRGLNVFCRRRHEPLSQPQPQPTLGPSTGWWLNQPIWKICASQNGNHFPKWVFPKIWYPQIIQFNRVFHYKPSILAHPYFWKHPNRVENKKCVLSVCHLAESFRSEVVNPRVERLPSRWQGIKTDTQTTTTHKVGPY